MRRIEVPHLPKVGSGVQLTYTPEYLSELFVGLELMSAVWTPRAIEAYFEVHRSHIRRWGGEAMEAPAEQYHVLIIKPRVTRVRGDDPGFQSLFTSTDSREFEEWYLEDIRRGNFERVLLISFDGLRQVAGRLAELAA